MKKIFFVSYGGSHAEVTRSVANYFKTSKKYEIKILGLTTGYSSLSKKNNFNVNSISDYLFLFSDIQDEISRYGEEFFLDNFDENSDVSSEDTKNYVGLSFWDLIEKYGESIAREKYSKFGRRIFEPLKVAERILSFEMPDLVITTSSPRFEIASIKAAKKLKIKTLQIFDIFATEKLPAVAAYIACVNQSQKKILLDKNLDSIVEAVGDPNSEKTKEKVKDIDVLKIKKKIGLKQNKKVILIATQKMLIDNNKNSLGKFLDNEKIFTDVFNNLKKLNNLSDYKILLRYHPVSENEFIYRKLNKVFPFFTIVNNILSLPESIAISKFVITHSSTVGLESIISGKKVITFKHKYESDFPYPEFSQLPFQHCEVQNINKELNSFADPLKENSYSKYMPANSLKNISNFIDMILTR